ncbi:MAG: hypothetical protein ACXWB9_05990 [Flavisolibacter sp.]
MKNRNPNLLLLLIIFLAIGTFLFFKLNNDHRECEVGTVESKNANGQIEQSTVHICNEIFPL